jgi:hypothetical protein
MLNCDFLNFWGSIASIISLLATCFIAWKVRKIKNKVEGLKQMQDIYQELDISCSKIAGMLPFENHNQEHIISLAELNSLCSQIERFSNFMSQTKKNSKQTKKLIIQFKKKKDSNSWDKIYSHAIDLRRHVKADFISAPYEGIQ